MEYISKSLIKPETIEKHIYPPVIAMKTQDTDKLFSLFVDYTPQKKIQIANTCGNSSMDRNLSGIMRSEHGGKRWQVEIISP